MKYRGKVLSVVLFALSSCGAPQNFDANLKSEITGLSKVTPRLLEQSASAHKLSGNFKSDLSNAILYSPEYLSAMSTVAATKSQILLANADRKLQVSATANAGQIVKNGAGASSSKDHGASVNLGVSQLIFDGGVNVASIDLARVKSFIAEMDVELVANNTAKEAAAAWVNIDTLNARDTLLQTLMTKTEKMLKQMETLVASGMIDKSTSASAEIAVRALLLEKANINAQIAAASASYMVFFGSVPENLSTPQSLLTPADLIQIQRNWSSAPILLQTSAQVVAARKSLSAAQGGEKPTVGFKAGVTSPMEKDERTTYAIGVEVAWIIGDGGRRKANTAAQAANLKAAEQKLKGAKLAGKRDLDTALSRRNTLIASLQTLAAQEVSSQNELKIMWSQLPTGQTSVRQLIQAEEKAYRTSDQKISVASELLKLDFEMLASSGLLTKKLGLVANKKTTKAEK